MMKRKTFARNLGLGGWVSLGLVVGLLAMQAIDEIRGDESANTLTWLVAGGLTVLMALVVVGRYLEVRTHNRQVDLEEKREAEQEQRFLNHLYGPGEE